MNMFKRFFWIFIASVVVLIVLSWLLASTIATEWFDKGILPISFNQESSSEGGQQSQQANSSSISDNSQSSVATSSESGVNSSIDQQSSSISSSEPSSGQSSTPTKENQNSSQSSSAQGEKQDGKTQYVVTVAGGSAFTALNWRDKPCGVVKGEPKPWGTRGQIFPGSTIQPLDNCPLGSFDWVHVKWDDGSDGWSIKENLQITDSLPK